MSNAAKISISMTPQQAELIRDAVESGAYNSSSEVVREAIRDWSAKWAARKDDIQRLREIWTEGKTSGKAAPIDFDDLLEEARQELRTASKRGS